MKKLPTVLSGSFGRWQNCTAQHPLHKELAPVVNQYPNPGKLWHHPIGFVDLTGIVRSWSFASQKEKSRGHFKLDIK